MPVSILIAIFLAFGLEEILGIGTSLGFGEAGRIGVAASSIAAVAGVSFAVGRFVAWRVDRGDYGSERLRRAYAIAGRLVAVLVLLSYASILYVANWRAIVEIDFGLRGAFFVDEFLILLPYLIAQFSAWWGLYAAERALRLASTRMSDRGGVWVYLSLKARQSLALALPIILIFLLGEDLGDRFAPKLDRSPWIQLALIGLIGATVLVTAPAFVRLSWPTSPLPDGPLRRRLETLMRRCGFRCSNILIWKTGHSLVNAGVTGISSRFRYVLLTDALVDRLDEHQIEAVFGHEIGHIARRHFLFFGLFFIGSGAVISLVALGAHEFIAWTPSGGLAVVFDRVDAIETGLVIIAAFVYFVVGFGHVSRRFEREADVYGCRAVSCGSDDCPPHVDVNAGSGMIGVAERICPVGVRTFASALAEVAELNGIDRGARSWRHGGIGKRIAFLESLENRPDDQTRFARGSRRFRGLFAMSLVVAVAAAIATGALSKALSF